MVFEYGYESNNALWHTEKLYFELKDNDFCLRMEKALK